MSRLDEVILSAFNEQFSAAPAQSQQSVQPKHPIQSEHPISSARPTQTARPTQPCVGVVFSDPQGELLRGLLPQCQAVLVASRTFEQAHIAEGVARAAGRRAEVTICGLDAPLRLDEALLGLLSGYQNSAVSVVAVSHLPKSLAELDYYARSLAGLRSLGQWPVSLVAGGNTKHMTHSQNSVLAESFAQVGALRGQGKFRCLVASEPKSGVIYAPSVGQFSAVGGVFSGTKPDRGGELLVQAAVSDFVSTLLGESAAGATATAPAAAPTTTPTPSASAPAGDPTTTPTPSAPNFAGTVLDLGCGNGSVSAALTDALPAAHVIATDISADAIASTELNVPSAIALWDDAAQSVPGGSVDAVFLNPPFHEGTAVDPTLVQGLLDSAHRLLRPDGVLYLVHNSHLRYRELVSAKFSSVSQLERDRRFTVLRATR